MEIKRDFTYKGTRILFGDKSKLKRNIINDSIYLLNKLGFTEMMIPIIQFQTTFEKKVGEENNNMMFNFKDRGDRDICLAPEYTAIVQLLSKTEFKFQKDVKLFYVAECFRGEKPQKGRYRQFTQLGVEIVNPTDDYIDYLTNVASELVYVGTSHLSSTPTYTVNTDVTRGLDYYKNGRGFEIEIPSLGAQKQVCGGGEYDGGIGFAIGIDRLLEI